MSEESGVQETLWEGFDGPSLANDDACERLAAFLQYLPECAPRFVSQPRGIVYCAGGADLLTEVWISLNLLRQTGCKLPVQVWHRHKDEMPPVVRELLASLGADSVNAEDLQHEFPFQDTNPTAFKLYAFLHCPFREVLLFDADTIPLEDPAGLFDLQEFGDFGALFWSDVAQPEQEEVVEEEAGSLREPDVFIDPGQVLLNKLRCWKAANLAAWHAIHAEFLEAFDVRRQDSLPLAFHETETAYWLCPWIPDSVEGVLIQYSPQGNPLFQHRKRWTFFGANSAGYTMRAAECLRLIDQLRERWDGRLGGIRRYRSATASPKRAEIASQLIHAVFDYIRHGYDARSLVFLEEGITGFGQGGRELYWDVYEASDGSDQWLLELANDQTVTCRMSLQPDGSWQGHWLTHEKMQVTLRMTRKPVSPDDSRFLATLLPSCLERGTLLTGLEWLESRQRDFSGDTNASMRFASISAGWSRRDPLGRFDDGITFCLAWYCFHSGGHIDIVTPPASDPFNAHRMTDHFSDAVDYATTGVAFFLESTKRLDFLYLNPSENSESGSAEDLATRLASLQDPPLILMWRRAAGLPSDEEGADPILRFVHAAGYRLISRTPSLAMFAWTKGEDLPYLSYTADTGTALLGAIQQPQPSNASQFWTVDTNLRMVTHDGGEFNKIQQSNVLIYWPHGFGDWVFLSYILPLFEPSNRYFITRFGDDTVSLFEDCEYITPLYFGHVAPIGDGKSVQRQKHFGLAYPPNQGIFRLEIPLSLFQVCSENDIRVVLWSGNPETHGVRSAPYHTKARNLIDGLASQEKHKSTDLSQPLRSCINFTPPSWILRWVESRLTNMCGFGRRKLCLVARQGFTAISKNWGHLWRDEMPAGRQREGQECREFMQMLLRKDPNWLFLVMEDKKFSGDNTVCDPAWNAYSYSALFGEIQSISLPYGLVMKSLIHLASLCVGVPTGPYHLSMASGTVPTVGIWLSHLPSWYDEPNPISRHLIGRHVQDMGFWNRPGSFEKHAAFQYDCFRSPERNIQAELVMAAVEELLF